MEKYRKFDDPITQINPFIPDKVQKRNLALKIIYCIQFLLGIGKFIFFISTFITLILLQYLKELLIVISIKRYTEILLTTIFSRILLFTIGVYNLNYKYKKNSDKTPNIIFSSQSTIIDWLLLMYNYTPKFLWIVKSSDNNNDILIELSYLDILFFGTGLKFLSRNKEYKQFDLINFLNTRNTNPIVIFPESTKTNRKGVLAIRSNVMNAIYDTLNDNNNILVRSEISIVRYNYFSPNNTTEFLGIINLFNTLCQIYNKIDIYSRDILNQNFNKLNNFDKIKFKTINDYLDNTLQSYLADPTNNNLLIITAADHISFLTYYHETFKDASYIKKDKSD